MNMSDIISVWESRLNTGFKYTKVRIYTVDSAEEKIRCLYEGTVDDFMNNSSVESLETFERINDNWEVVSYCYKATSEVEKVIPIYSRTLEICLI